MRMTKPYLQSLTSSTTYLHQLLPLSSRARRNSLRSISSRYVGHDMGNPWVTRAPSAPTPVETRTRGHGYGFPASMTHGLPVTLHHGLPMTLHHGLPMTLHHAATSPT